MKYTYVKDELYPVYYFGVTGNEEVEIDADSESLITEYQLAYLKFLDKLHAIDALLENSKSG